MRKLKGKDLFPAMRLLYSLDMKDELKKMSVQDESQEEAGFSLIFDIFGKALKKESEEKVFQFLSGPFEMSVEDIQEMDMDKICHSFVYDIGVSDLINFFKRAAQAIH